MTIGEAIKRKDRNTYEKLLQMAGGKIHEKKMDKTKRRRIHQKG